MTHRLRIIDALMLALAVACFAGRATACFWDRDTLAQEARGMPHIVDALIGRIDRWPPAVYEQRLAAVAQQLGGDPTRLDLYDDAAVASDRLGRREEAVEWMQRKRGALDALRIDAPERVEHEYRYLANLGTILAHRWIAAGANNAIRDDLTQAIAHIRAAIALNPDAHFGREPVQLAMLERLAVAERAQPDRLHWFIESLHPIEDYSGRFAVAEIDPSGVIDDEMMIEGLVGLIVLGDAWASVDVYAALAEVLARRADSSLALLALARAEELAAAGKRSLIFGDRTDEALARVRGELENFLHPEEAQAYFERARRWAERENDYRNEYIAAALAAGRHPDTDAAFMDGFKPTHRPALPGGFLGTDIDRFWGWTVTWLGGATIAVIGLCIFVCRWFIRRRDTTEHAPAF